MSERLSPAFLTTLALVTASILVSACASTVMKSYIGAPITSVMLDYGPPDNIYSLGGAAGLPVAEEQDTGCRRIIKWRSADNTARRALRSVRDAGLCRAHRLLLHFLHTQFRRRMVCHELPATGARMRVIVPGFQTQPPRFLTAALMLEAAVFVGTFSLGFLIGWAGQKR